MRFSSLAIVIALIFSTISITVSYAEGQRCDAISSEHKRAVSTLFSYALLEEWAFHQSRRPRASCAPKGDEYELSAPNYDKIEVTEVDYTQFNALYQRQESVPVIYRTFEDGQDRYFVSCGIRASQPQASLAINLRRTQQTIDLVVSGDPVTYSASSFLPDVVVVAPRETLEDDDAGVDATLLRNLLVEEAEIALVTRQSSDLMTENIALIRGTNTKYLARLWKQLLTSLRASDGASCVFPLVANIVIEVIMNEGDEKDSLPLLLSVVGSSLGGTVAQYIADHRQSHPNLYRDIAHRIVTFRAYSFNGMGLPVESGEKNRNAQGLVSYVINGDYVRIPGQHQQGTVVTYYPGPWSLLNRHTIEVVQNALCRCHELGKGSISFE